MKYTILNPVEFKEIITFMNKIGPESKFNFDDNGLTMTVINDSNTYMARAVIPKSLFKNYQKVVGAWGTVSERAYYNIIQPKYPLKD